jgi:hypothetical protein
MKLSPMTERAPNPTTRAHTGNVPAQALTTLVPTLAGAWSPEGARSRGRRRVRRCRQPYFDNRRL